MAETLKDKQLETPPMDWVCSPKARSDAASENRKMLEPALCLGLSSQKQKSEAEPKP